MIEITPEYLASQDLSADFPKRFWSKVKKNRGCWIWKATKVSFGYGNIARGDGRKNPVSAHIASWILNRGPIPKGKCVLHNCPGGDNPSCVNPKHLWIGTKQENTLDAVKKGTWKKTHPTRRGEQHSCSVLTEKEVREIRRIHSLKLKNQRQLAFCFGVHFATINDIVLRKRWKHI